MERGVKRGEEVAARVSHDRVDEPAVVDHQFAHLDIIVERGDVHQAAAVVVGRVDRVGPPRQQPAHYIPLPALV